MPRAQREHRSRALSKRYQPPVRALSLDKQLSDCSSPSLSPPARPAAQAGRLRRYDLFREAHGSRRSRLCVFVGMQADHPYLRCSRAEASQARVAAPQVQTGRAGRAVGLLTQHRNAACWLLLVASTQWRESCSRSCSCSCAAEQWVVAYHHPQRSMGAEAIARRKHIGSALNFGGSGERGILLGLCALIGLAAIQFSPTPLATCRLILPFPAPPTLLRLLLHLHASAHDPHAALPLHRPAIFACQPSQQPPRLFDPP